MFSLRRQWHRFQLARELLEQYEYGEAHRIPAAEAIRRIEAASLVYRTTSQGAVARWAEAARAKAEQYPPNA